ncbi:lipoprotein insertase outer membrane protein LolB [Halomonas sp. M20]|uniref:lipoprotein insertase outer membrane protein LolB n=1 Tax=Halomonas sp. M20 TaxID=2763264 RepID=UPI001D09EB1A|nr:lipoprotein insertase outer membrane protein LolB [Halomonas sp. M20]
MTRTLFLLLSLLLLVGCAAQAPTPDAPRQSGDWPAQLEQLKTLESWRLAGKVGLRTANDATSANLDWQQTPFSYRMMISGPFGAGRSTLDGSPGGVTLTTPDGRFSARTPEQLMQQQLGWSLPISAMDYWVRGLPAPNAAHEMQADALGFPQQLRQAGWTIDYRDWTWAPRLNGGLWLPRRLVMTFDDLRATLVVNQWQPLDTATSP